MEAARADDPIPLIVYAQNHKLTKLPYWTWTTAFSPEEVDQLSKAYATRAELAPKYKFGVQVPKSIKHALQLDRINGNGLWREAIQKEMSQLSDYKTFRLPKPGEDLSEFQRIPYHMVFDVKFDGRRKARLVAQGNKAIVPAEDVYSGVVGIETVRLVLALAAMDDYQVCAADIGNAFLYGKNKEKTMIIAGPEFGDELKGQTLIVEGGWYGHKSAAATFHEHLSAKLRTMGFKPTLTDQDLWIRRKHGKYEYLASYVDDVIAISPDPMAIIGDLKKTYILKGVGVPEYYLGGNFDNVTDPELTKQGIKTSLGARTYISNIIEKFERMFDGDIRQAHYPMQDLHPETDDSPLLSDDMASKYRGIIGSLNWIVTLGRFDVLYATNTLARFSMAPREQHLIMAKRILGYLKKFPHYRIVLNPNPFETSQLLKNFTEQDNWKEFYPEAMEEIPKDRPEAPPNARKVQITIFVDADHAHCEVTRRSVTGIVVFVNSTPVKWFSKMQRTVETSTYGSELVAARIATDFAMELRYNIRMLGFDLDGPTTILGDNNAVVLNTTIPSSQLKKKQMACAYHRVREMIACRATRFIHIPSHLNCSDINTKPLTGTLHQSITNPIFTGNGVPRIFQMLHADIYKKKEQ
jgi:hypothetical protein